MPATPRISRDYVPTLSNDQLLELAMNYTNFLLNDEYAVWDMFIVTIMFHHIGGNNDNRKFLMQKEVHRIYEVLASRLFRDPYSPTQFAKLSRWVLFADCSDVAVINDSLHYQGLGIFHPFNRHGEPIMVLIERFQKMLCGNHGVVARVHLKRVTRTPEKVQRYVAKTVLNRKSSFEDVVVLPKSRGDYSKRGSRNGPIEPQILRLLQNLEPEQQQAEQKPRKVLDLRRYRTKGKRRTF